MLSLYRTVSFQVAQDGAILLFWSQSENGLIYAKRSDDGGKTWEGEYESTYLPDGPPDVYGAKGGLVRLPIEDSDVLIYSSPKDHHTSIASRLRCVRVSTARKLGPLRERFQTKRFQVTLGWAQVAPEPRAKG